MKRILALAILLLLLSPLLPMASAQVEFEHHVVRHYRFRVHGRDVSLSILIPRWLYTYYVQKPHVVLSHQDLAAFATPDAVRPIAEALRSLFEDDEEFANAVLAFTLQLPYVNTTRAYLHTLYPIEALVESGVCDEHAILAASIMRAGGLGVSLLYYPITKHLNVGVELGHWPRHAAEPVSSYFHDGRQYFVAEATPDAGRIWRLGEAPQLIRHEEPVVIPLERFEESLGSVSARLGALPKLASLDAEIPKTVFQLERAVVKIALLDELYKPVADAPVSYAIYNGILWRTGTLCTTEAGEAQLQLEFELPGKYYVQVSFPGSPELKGAYVEAEVAALPTPALACIVALAYALAGAGAIVAVARSRRI